MHRKVSGPPFWAPRAPLPTLTSTSFDDYRRWRESVGLHLRSLGLLYVLFLNPNHFMPADLRPGGQNRSNNDAKRARERALLNIQATGDTDVILSSPAPSDPGDRALYDEACDAAKVAQILYEALDEPLRAITRFNLRFPTDYYESLLFPEIDYYYEVGPGDDPELRGTTGWPDADNGCHVWRFLEDYFRSSLPSMATGMVTPAAPATAPAPAPHQSQAAPSQWPWYQWLLRVWLFITTTATLVWETYPGYRFPFLVDHDPRTNAARTVDQSREAMSEARAAGPGPSNVNPNAPSLSSRSAQPNS